MIENFSQFDNYFSKQDEKSKVIEGVRLRIGEIAGEATDIPNKTVFHDAIIACDKWIAELDTQDVVDTQLLNAILDVKDEFRKKFEEETK